MLKREVPTHPPYTPATALSNYHLSASITHGIAEQRFSNYEKTKMWVMWDSCIMFSQLFSRCGIQLFILWEYFECNNFDFYMLNEGLIFDKIMGTYSRTNILLFSWHLLHCASQLSQQKFCCCSCYGSGLQIGTPLSR